MKVIVKATTLIFALGLVGTQAHAQAGPGYSPYEGRRAGYQGAGPDYGYRYAGEPRSVSGRNRWDRAAGDPHPYAVRPPRSAYDVAIGGRRLAYGVGFRRGLTAGAAYAAAPRLSYYAYRPRVRYAYAETPFAYDLPRETYATGIFGTTSTIGLHTYDYAYTTQVRPIAAYSGATGSYAGGYPIYNRPLAPAYPTPSCDCD
jgi:hypothetical protein